MAAAGGIHSLATILKRLETVTSRLEDVATATTGAPLISQTTTSAVHEGMAGGAVNGAGAQASTSAPAASQPATPAVKAYKEDIVESALAEFVQQSSQLGEIVSEHAQLVAALCSAQLSFLTLASQSRKPASPPALLQVLEPTQQALQRVVAYKDEKSRTKDGRAMGNHLSAVGEGAGAFGWVAVEPTPAPFVGEMKDSAQFYTNRVLKEFKDTDPKHVSWAKSYLALLDSLQKYVKQWHTTGVAWNPQGGDASAAAASSAATSSAPPPPPPPPPHVPDGALTAASKPAPAAGGPSAFLAQLNQGAAVTSGLKKVDPSEMTHKNPALRAGSVVADSGASKAPTKPSKPATLATKKPAKTELDGTKWIVEYHENNQEVIIDNTEINHTVQIFGCKSSVIQIKGKVNAINMVNCTKTSVLLESVVSQLSITSSPSFTVQILGAVPTILIDTTDSGQVYLSKQCVDSTEIVTSKTSALNISVPSGEEGDFDERPVPEQMRTVVKGGKLVTSIVEHSG